MFNRRFDMRASLMLLLLLVGLSALAQAADTSTRRDILLHEDGWVDGPNRNTVLLIETISTFLDQALTELAVAHDVYAGEDFSALDLSGYDHVFVGMDGGMVEAPSIANVAGWAANGGCLHFYGGTAWGAYVEAMNQLLLQNDTSTYYWTVSTTPHSTIVDAGHYLAAGLPASYNFIDDSAAYYQIRSTDGAVSVAAVNGDQYHHLMSKILGQGSFDICINSSYESYYTNLDDYNWGKQVVANMLSCQGGVASEAKAWGGVKSLFR